MDEGRTVLRIVVAEFVAFGFDALDQVGVGKCSFADQEKCGLGFMATKDIEDQRSKDRMRTVVEGERQERLRGWNAIEEVGCESLKESKNAERLDPEDVGKYRDRCDGNEIKHWINVDRNRDADALEASTRLGLTRWRRTLGGCRDR